MKTLSAGVPNITGSITTDDPGKSVATGALPPELLHLEQHAVMEHTTKMDQLTMQHLMHLAVRQFMVTVKQYNHPRYNL